MTPEGVATSFPLPTPAASAQAIVSGPDGKLWFTEWLVARIASIDPTAPDPGTTIVEYPLEAESRPYGVTVGPDGLIWFTEQVGNRVGHLDPHAADVKASIVELDLPSRESNPSIITSGPNGRLWFTVQDSGRIDFVTTDGRFGGFDLPVGYEPYGIAPGPDGALWFTSALALPPVPPGEPQPPGKDPVIGRMTTNGALTATSLPHAKFVSVITPGPGGTLWFTQQESDGINRISDITGLTEPPPTTAPPTTQPPPTTAPPTTQPPTTQPPPGGAVPGASPAPAIVGTPRFTG
jgi:virginiamycin B lyase